MKIGEEIIIIIMLIIIVEIEEEEEVIINMNLEVIEGEIGCNCIFFSFWNFCCNLVRLCNNWWIFCKIMI